MPRWLNWFQKLGACLVPPGVRDNRNDDDGDVYHTDGYAVDDNNDNDNDDYGFDDDYDDDDDSDERYQET